MLFRKYNLIIKNRPQDLIKDITAITIDPSVQIDVILND